MFTVTREVLLSFATGLLLGIGIGNTDLGEKSIDAIIKLFHAVYPRADTAKANVNRGTPVDSTTLIKKEILMKKNSTLDKMYDQIQSEDFVKDPATCNRALYSVHLLTLKWAGDSEVSFSRRGLVKAETGELAPLCSIIDGRCDAFCVYSHTCPRNRDILRINVVQTFREFTDSVMRVV